MPRPVASDFLHSMRFHVAVADPNVSKITGPGADGAGFSMVTTPEVNVEAVEYREGTFVYTRKYPGNPTTSDISMSRGVTTKDSSFWDWLRVVVEGSGEYRNDLLIKHYHREQALNREKVTTGGASNLVNISTETPARTYKVFQAFPIRHKVAGDLDATASEVSIMELDVAYEYFEIESAA